MTEDRSQTSNEPVSETSAAAWRADRLSGPLGITVNPPGERRPAPVLTAALKRPCGRTGQPVR